MDVVSAETIALAVTLHRKKAGLTRQALAELAGVSASAVYHVEHSRPTTQLSTLLKLFAVLSLQLKLEGPYLKELPTAPRST